MNRSYFYAGLVCGAFVMWIVFIVVTVITGISYPALNVSELKEVIQDHDMAGYNSKNGVWEVNEDAPPVIKDITKLIDK